MKTLTRKQKQAKKQAIKDMAKERTLYLHYEDLVLAMNQVLPTNVSL